MTPYGKDFQDYFIARRLFFEKESKRDPWIILGLLVQLELVILGVFLLPTVHLLLWAAAMIVSGALVLSGLISIAWKQRKYTSFDRWIKYREQQSKDATRISGQRSGKSPGWKI